MANDVQKYNETGLERMLDSFFDGWNVRGGKIPPVDIEETDGEYVIKASLPGVNEKELEVHVDDHVLHIAGKSFSSNDEKKRHYILRERVSSTFDRAFTLPEEADEENISAGFEKGVLTLTVPKKAKQEAKKISVTINK
ncbi:MAG: Hsp20/alpha crystallin family protein [Sphaerochaetaceae bacterium]|nr:Hsp20/alpha crystallin family protein [Sphaerochaetaceae bacterium]